MDKKIVMFDDPNLVQYRTDLEGWTGPDNLYHGKGEEGERRARYANSTHKKCDCGNVMDKYRITCRTCDLLNRDNRFLKLEEVDWDGESYMCLRDGDKFFSDMDEVLIYCEEEEVELQDIDLMLCEQNYVFHEINLDEIYDDYITPNDETFSDFHPEIAQKVRELNELLKNEKSKLWFGTNKRIKL